MNIIKNRILLIFTTYIIFTFNSQCADGLKILGLFPLHGKSHFVMCESLVKGLVQRGHQVDVYSHFPQKVPIPNYKDYSLHGTLPGLVNNMSFEFFQQSPSMKIQLALKRVGNPICELMDTPVFQDLFERLKKDQPYDLIIIEVFLSNCFLAWGRYLKIPMIGVATTSLPDWLNEPLGNPINTAIEQSGWSGYFHPMNFWERLINTYKYHMRAIEYNYYMKDQNKYVEKYFGPGYPDVTKLLKDLDLLLVNTHYTFDGIRPFTSAIIPVAGLHIFDDKTKLPNDVQDWLDKSKDGCIYFSFGSMVRIETFPKSILDAFYATFRNIAPVRVLLKIAKPEVLPPGLPSNVMTRPWFSQLQVLKHKNIKGFVTHGGLMSTQESLYAGVPMISVPLFGDQNLNAKSLAKKELAVMMELQYITEKTFTETVKEILNNPTYKMNAEKFSKKFLDRPLSAMDTAAFWIEYISRHGKGALKSPIVDMPWWESKLIDVYGFILIIFISIYLILKLILKRMKSCFISTDDKQKQNKKSKKYD